MTSHAAKARLLEPCHSTNPIDEFGVETAHEGAAAAASPVPTISSHLSPPGKASANGRSFVTVAVLGLLVIAQTPFVVLWAVEFGKPTPIVIATSDIVRHRMEMTSAPVTAVSSIETPAVAPEPPRVRVTAPPHGALSGYVDIDVPVSLRISENGEFLGTTEIDRLMLPVGEHVLELSSDDLRFRVQRVVTVNPGATTTVQFDLPRASLSINARPWAEVWVDGERVGETPIGNLLRPIGRHDVVLRHPQLGERRSQVLITLNEPAHVSVDLRQQN